MTRNRLKSDNRRGVATVEFAIVLPLLFTLMVGIWEVARMVDVQQILTSAAREGGRQAVAGQMTNANVIRVVLHHLNNEGIQVTDGNDNPLPGVVVNIQNNTSPGLDASQANQLDYLTISVTLPFRYFRWSTLNYFAPAGANLNATVGWYSVKDITFTISQTIPNQPQ
jgi:hypothetical protein